MSNCSIFQMVNNVFCIERLQGEINVIIVHMHIEKYKIIVEYVLKMFNTLVIYITKLNEFKNILDEIKHLKNIMEIL